MRNLGGHVVASSCRRNEHRRVKPRRAWLNVRCVSWAAPCRRRNCPCSGCDRRDWPGRFHRRDCNDCCTFSIRRCISRGRPAQKNPSSPRRKIQLRWSQRSEHASCKSPASLLCQKTLCTASLQTVAKPAATTHWTRGQCNRPAQAEYDFRRQAHPRSDC